MPSRCVSDMTSATRRCPPWRAVAAVAYRAGAALLSDGRCWPGPVHLKTRLAPAYTSQNWNIIQITVEKRSRSESFGSKRSSFPLKIADNYTREHVCWQMAESKRCNRDRANRARLNGAEIYREGLLCLLCISTHFQRKINCSGFAITVRFSYCSCTSPLVSSLAGPPAHTHSSKYLRARQ